MCYGKSAALCDPVTILISSARIVAKSTKAVVMGRRGRKARGRMQHF